MNTLDILGRLLLASFLGALIGLERERKNRAAGLRTHIIVSLASCLIMLIAVDGFEGFYGDKGWDATKFAGQAISGIGFLGAGTILQKKDVVKGLTTAATLWLCAANGLAVGIGYYEGAVIATFICLITLINLKGINDFLNKRDLIKFYMQFDSENFNSKDFKELCAKENVEVRALEVLDTEGEMMPSINCDLSFPNNYNVDAFLKLLSDELSLIRSDKKN